NTGRAAVTTACMGWAGWNERTFYLAGNFAPAAQPARITAVRDTPSRPSTPTGDSAMPATPPIRIVLGTWDRLRDDAYVVRHEVFVVEQGVPRDIELDDYDALSVHAVAYDRDGSP